MNSLVKAWNPTENYWSLHPMMTTFLAFKEYYAQDKTKGKVESSRVMWAIAMLLDPHTDNVLRSIERGDRIRIISEDFLEAPDFDWDHTYVVELIKDYKFLALTHLERQVINFQKKLEQRDIFLDQTNYTLDSYSESSKAVVKGTAKELDVMMINTSKLNVEYRGLTASLEAEENAGDMKGGATESAGESGAL